MKKADLYNHVKSALRVTTDDAGIKSEIEMLIASAKMDLILSGIGSSFFESEEIEDLLVLAITLYCKAHFGFDNPDHDKLVKVYKDLEIHLSLSTKFGGEASAT